MLQAVVLLSSSLASFRRSRPGEHLIDINIELVRRRKMRILQIVRLIPDIC